MKQLALLKRIAKHDNSPFGVGQLAKDANVSRETVRVVLARLEKLRLVRRAHSAYNYRHYRKTDKFPKKWEDLWEDYEAMLLVERQMLKAFREA